MKALRDGENNDEGKGLDSYDYHNPEYHSLLHQYVSSSKYYILFDAKLEAFKVMADEKRLQYLAEDGTGITSSSSSEEAQARHAVARPGSHVACKGR